MEPQDPQGKAKVRLANDFFFLIAQGTTAVQTARKLLLIAEQEGHPLRHGENCWLMGFDQFLGPAESGGEIGGRPDPMAPYHIQARLADRESRLALHERGALWWQTREQCENPGVRKDQNGTGGIPASGRADFAMNEPPVSRWLTQGLQASDDVCRKLRVAVKHGASPAEEALPCFVLFSTVGGEGSGSFVDVCRELRRLASRQGIHVKIILCPIDAGTSLPPNRFVALRNRCWSWNTIRAHMTGRYREPGRTQEALNGPLFDMVILCSNTGRSSQITDLAAQQALLAKLLVRMMCSVLGRRLREDIVDLDAHRGVDASGAPCGVSTFGSASIDLDRPRLLRGLCPRLALAQLRALLDASGGDAAERGRQAAAQLQLVESEAEAQTTRALTAASDASPDAYTDVQSVLNSPLATYKASQGIEPLDEAYRAVSQGHVQEVIVPRMKERAKAMVEEVKANVRKVLELFGKDVAGLRKGLTYVKALLAAVEVADRMVREKHEAALQGQEAGAEELGRIQDLLEELAQRHVLARMARTFSRRDLLRRYRDVIEHMARLDIDQAALRAAAEEVYMALQEYLLSMLRDLQFAVARLEDAVQECQRQIERSRQASSSVLRTPVGHQLVDAEFIDAYWERVVAERGREALVGQVFASMLEASGGCLAHIQAHHGDLASDLCRRAERLLEAGVRSLDVVQVFRERHGEVFGAGILEQVIKESGPRLRIQGEAGRSIPVAKLLGVPKGSDGTALLEEVNRLDRTEGRWELVEVDELDSILFVTYRSSVSPTAINEQHPFTMDARPAAERTDGAADPVLAILPAGKMTVHDARVAAVYAQASSLLDHGPETGYRLRLEDGEHRELGTTAHEALQSLRQGFGDDLHILSSLAEGLVGDGRACLEAFRQMGTTLGAPDDNPLAALYDREALDRAVDEVKALMPFLQNVKPGRSHA